MFYPLNSLTSRRFSRGALLLLTSVVLSACGTFSGVDSVTREDGTKKPAELIVILKTRKEAIDAVSDAALKQQMRNDLQNQIIRLSDDACNSYLRGITRLDIQRKLFFNSISIIAGGVAPLFSSGTTESLAVASGLATAANAEITSTVFKQLAFNVVESAIRKNRKDRRDDFEEFQKRPIAEYGVEAALRDAGDYHQRCALRRGIEVLATKNQLPAPSKVALESELEKVREFITTARVALSGTATVDALTGDARKTTDNELKRAIIEESRIRALLPYAR